MDVFSYLLGKKAGGGGSDDYNVLISSEASYKSTYRISALITEVKPFTLRDDIANINNLFYGCWNLKEVPVIDLSNVTSCTACFQYCSQLETAPLWDTSTITAMASMFSNCTNLKNVPILDMSSVTDAKNMFDSCPSLTDDSLDNILQMCIGATSYTSTKTLLYMGIKSTTYEDTRIQALPHYADFIAAGWTIGY